MSRSLWQAFAAVLNLGEVGSMPMLGLISSPPSLDGSGKFRIPCDRMQAEKAAPFLPFVPSPFDPPLAEESSLVDVPMFATPGVFEPPPQPAASNEAATSARAPTSA
jgi:hypothetical protein